MSQQSRMQRERDEWAANRIARLGIDSAEALYRHTEPSRFRPQVKDTLSSGTSADWHYRAKHNFYYSAEVSRELDRVDPIFGAAITRLVDNLIQGGFGLQAQTGIAAIDDYVEPRWIKWAATPEKCDATQRLDHCGLTHLFVRSMFVDGDIFKLADGSGRVGVEYHRCQTPQWKSNDPLTIHGVETNDYGVPVRYWFTQYDPAPGRPFVADSVQSIDARDAYGLKQVVHLFLPKRLSQNRGVTIAAPIADLSGMVDDIQFAKLVQQQAVSAVAMFHKFKSEPSALVDPGSTPEYPTHLQGTWSALRGVAGGMEYWGYAGEELEALSANIPNPEYFKQMMMILGIIAANLGLPVQVLLLDPTATNFSGWRGAIDQARIGLGKLQQYIATAHYSSDYRWFIQYLIATDMEFRRILYGSAFDFLDPWGEQNEWLYEHKFLPPAWRYIQPVEDITARRMDVASGFTSPRRQHAEFNSDFYQVTDEKIADNSYAIEEAIKAAQRLNQKYAEANQPVTWRDLWQPVTLDNTNVTLQPVFGEPPEPTGGSGDGEESQKIDD